MKIVCAQIRSASFSQLEGGTNDRQGLNPCLLTWEVRLCASNIDTTPSQGRIRMPLLSRSTLPRARTKFSRSCVDPTTNPCSTILQHQAAASQDKWAACPIRRATSTQRPSSSMLVDGKARPRARCSLFRKDPMSSHNCSSHNSGPIQVSTQRKFSPSTPHSRCY